MAKVKAAIGDMDRGEQGDGRSFHPELGRPA